MPFVPLKQETGVEFPIAVSAEVAIIIFTTLLVVQPLASVTNTLYCPTPRLLIVWLPETKLAGPVQEYKYWLPVAKVVPPKTKTLADPVLSPKQRTSVCCTVFVNRSGSIIVADVVIVQPFQSVTTTVYSPGQSPEGEISLIGIIHGATTSVLLQIYEAYSPEPSTTPPLTSSVIEPSLAPNQVILE